MFNLDLEVYCCVCLNRVSNDAYSLSCFEINGAANLEKHEGKFLAKENFG